MDEKSDKHRVWIIRTAGGPGVEPGLLTEPREGLQRVCRFKDHASAEKCRKECGSPKSWSVRLAARFMIKRHERWLNKSVDRDHARAMELALRKVSKAAGAYLRSRRLAPNTD